jgi:hypothetical protein
MVQVLAWFNVAAARVPQQGVPLRRRTIERGLLHYRRDSSESSPFAVRPASSRYSQALALFH